MSASGAVIPADAGTDELLFLNINPPTNATTRANESAYARLVFLKLFMGMCCALYNTPVFMGKAKVTIRSIGATWRQLIDKKIKNEELFNV